MGENTLNSVALELLSNLLDNIGDIVVCGSFSDDALGGLETVPCGENNVSLGASDWLVTDNNSGGGVRSIAIEVGSANAAQKDFYNMTLSHCILKISNTKFHCALKHLLKTNRLTSWQRRLQRE